MLFDVGVCAPLRLSPGLFRDEDLPALVAALALEQREAHMGDRTVLVPRLEGWWAPPSSAPYAFGGRAFAPRPRWPDRLELLRARVSQETGERFNACFANFYRGGQDCIDWHSDDDRWSGPVVASLSFGATRRFVLRRKDAHKTKQTVHLAHGDLLVMLAGCQEEWQHCVPRERGQVGARLNLTFRVVRAGGR